jgi:hypothetical protein
MWFNRLSGYLLKLGYKNGPICIYVFIKKFGYDFVILAIYVDHINLIGTSKDLQEAKDCLK